MEKIITLFKKMNEYAENHNLAEEDICLRIYPDGSGVVTRNHINICKEWNKREILLFDFESIEDLKNKLDQ